MSPQSYHAKLASVAGQMGARTSGLTARCLPLLAGFESVHHTDPSARVSHELHVPAALHVSWASTVLVC